MANNQKIVDTIWCPSPFGCIGIVMIEDELTKERRVYIGLGYGVDQQDDAEHIAAHGGLFAPDYARRILAFWRKKEGQHPGSN